MPRKVNPDAPYWRHVREAERSILTYTLDNAESLTQVALLLGVSKAFIIEKAQELGIKPPRQRRANKAFREVAPKPPRASRKPRKSRKPKTSVEVETVGVEAVVEDDVAEDIDIIIEEDDGHGADDQDA